jgi:hypothetical protein
MLVAVVAVFIQLALSGPVVLVAEEMAVAVDVPVLVFLEPQTPEEVVVVELPVVDRGVTVVPA